MKANLPEVTEKFNSSSLFLPDTSSGDREAETSTIGETDSFAAGFVFGETKSLALMKELQAGVLY